MIKEVVFDFGGVVHSLDGVFTRGGIAVAYGLKVEEIALLLDSLLERMGLGVVTEDEFWNELSAKTAKPIPEERHEVLRKELRENACLYPEIINLVRDLRMFGVGLAVLSNTIPPHAEVIKEKGWYGMFDEVFLSCELGLRKPDKKIYELVLSKLGLRGEECVFVDDLQENLLPAGELKMKTVLAVSPGQVVFDVKTLLA